MMISDKIAIDSNNSADCAISTANIAETSVTSFNTYDDLDSCSTKAVYNSVNDIKTEYLNVDALDNYKVATTSSSTSTSTNTNYVTTNPYSTYSNYTIDNSWSNITGISISDVYFNKDDAETQFNVLENYFKMNLIKTNKYDRELNREEFLDLVTLFIKQITKKDCKVDFTKDMLLEKLTFKLDETNLFTLDNSKDLYPETYLLFRDVFYVNTDNLLKVLKKATFNRLLNV